MSHRFLSDAEYQHDASLDFVIFRNKATDARNEARVIDWQPKGFVPFWTGAEAIYARHKQILSRELEFSSFVALQRSLAFADKRAGRPNHI